MYFPFNKTKQFEIVAIFVLYIEMKRDADNFSSVVYV